MSLEALSGRRYGPVPYRITAERVHDFIAATGDDPGRWRAAAPPGFAAALLFGVAPLLIGDPDVGESTRVLVHTEQRFAWERPLAVDTAFVLDGEITRVRSRGTVSFVELEVTATREGEPVLSSHSTFLMGSEPAAEPGPDRGEPEVTAGPSSDSGDATVRGASRLDLVRYAAASGDFNPIHFDHDAARAAGLDGIVVHGLLMASWLCQEAVACSGVRTDPLAELRLRFRSALAAGESAVVECTAGEPVDGMVAVSLALRRGDIDLVTGSGLIRHDDAEPAA
jgi:acyl dehydratase